jgi:RHS repeat-associated protein
MTRDKLLLLANDILPGGPDQRFYASTYGRFNTPDPYQASAKGANNPNNPGSWNHYAYAGGDPVNRVDPTGQLWAEVCGGFGDEGEGSAEPCGEPVDPLCGNLLDGVPEPGCSYTIPEKPVVQPQPTCEINVFTRGITGTAGIAQHTYLEITETGASDPSGDFDNIIEGVPTNPHNAVKQPKTGWGTLNVVTEATAGAPYVGNTNPATNHELGSITGAGTCLEVLTLEGAVASYNIAPQVQYALFPNGKTTFNSNSTTYTLLNDIGAAATFGAVIGWSPGWGATVPGLQP